MSETSKPPEPANLLSEYALPRAAPEVGGVAVDSAVQSHSDSVASGGAQTDATDAVEAAAVRSLADSVPPARTSDRIGYWTAATPEQVNRAAQRRYDLTRQSKY